MKEVKIDLYLLSRGRGTWEYHASTKCKTCREAKERFLAANPYLSQDQVKARKS